MRKMLLVAAVVAVVTVPSARADDLVLRSGRTLSGRIVKEDEKSITFESGSGTLTFARADVREIRRCAPPAPAAPTAPPPPAQKPESAKTAKQPAAPTPAPASGAAAGASGGRKTAPTPAERLAALQATRLESWVEDQSVPAEEPGAKGFKVVRDDGTTSMTDERPANGTGVRALYIRKDAGCGEFIEIRDGVRRTYWHRLYWQEKLNSWDFTHPNLAAFHRETREAQDIAEASCADKMAWIATCCDARGIELVMQSNRSAPAAKERRSLRDDCVKAAGSEAGGASLVRFHELSVEIAFTRDPGTQIALAMKRREALAAVVAAAVPRPAR